MNDTGKNHTAALEELSTFRQEAERLRTLSADTLTTEAWLARLADFPEKNPDILVETSIDGHVAYLNLMAQTRFPTLWQEGFNHPLLQGMPAVVRAMANAGQSYSVDEIGFGESFFERQICYAQGADGAFLRIYLHDITRCKQAEKTIHKLAKQLVYTQVEERRLLSRELHDEAGQALTALKFSLELLRSDPPSDTEVLCRRLGEVIALTESTMECVRLLAHGLRPPALDTLGLNRTLQACCENFAQRTRIPVKYRGCDIPELIDVMAMCLYRVLQESLTNIAKHSGASRIRVNLTHTAKQVRLEVVDNGCGIDLSAVSALPRTNGIGLLGMRERLELLEGRLELSSAPGQGLRLAAVLPLQVEL